MNKKVEQNKELIIYTKECLVNAKKGKPEDVYRKSTDQKNITWQAMVDIIFHRKLKNEKPYLRG